MKVFIWPGYRAHVGGRSKYDGVRAIKSGCYIFVNPSTFDDVCANNFEKLHGHAIDGLTTLQYRLGAEFCVTGAGKINNRYDLHPQSLYSYAWVMRRSSLRWITRASMF